MNKFILLSVLLCFSSSVQPMPAVPDPPARALQIYYVDVEGGAATLIVTPTGESVLVDAGWPGFESRDAKRIVQAMKQAGITAIDHLVITHYHRDHFGGVPELARLVKIKHFYDHGPMSSLAEDREFAPRYAAYLAAAGQKTTTLKPGDVIRLRQSKGTPSLLLQCLAARRNVIKAEGTSNAECATATMQAEDPSDNAQSIAFLLKYGDFDFLDAGDLTWNIEHKLVCPARLIGEVDLYQVTHHGTNTSNNLTLLRSVRPTVAIMNNGPRKGGHPDVVRALRALSSLQDAWQVHRNVTSSEEENAPADFIANLEETPDAAHMITVSVDAAQRSFTVTNQRNQHSKTYSFK